MFMGGSVVHNLRAVLPEYHIHPAAVADGSNKDNQVQAVSVFSFQLLLDLISVVLIDIQNDELLRMVRSI